MSRTPSPAGGEAASSQHAFSQLSFRTFPPRTVVQIISLPGPAPGAAPQLPEQEARSCAGPGSCAPLPSAAQGRSQRHLLRAALLPLQHYPPPPAPVKSNCWSLLRGKLGRLKREHGAWEPCWRSPPSPWQGCSPLKPGFVLPLHNFTPSRPPQSGRGDVPWLSLRGGSGASGTGAVQAGTRRRHSSPALTSTPRQGGLCSCRTTEPLG